MSQFLAPRLHSGLAARSCKQNMYDQNLFDDEANISFHFEANNLFGHRREAGFMDKGRYVFNWGGWAGVF